MRTTVVLLDTTSSNGYIKKKPIENHSDHIAGATRKTPTDLQERGLGKKTNDQLMVQVSKKSQKRMAHNKFRRTKKEMGRKERNGEVVDQGGSQYIIQGLRAIGEALDHSGPHHIKYNI